MTTLTPDPAGQPDPTPEVPPEPDPADPPDPAGEPEGGNSEAAKYRRRLRQAEADRDTLGEQVTRLLRAQVERAAAEHLAVAADVWTFGAELPELLDDNGDVDDSKVTTAVRGIVAERPGLARTPARPNMGQGRRELPGEPSVSWSKVLKGG